MNKMNRKADIPMWLVGMIIALLVLFILIAIVAKSGDFNKGFLDFLRNTI